MLDGFTVRVRRLWLAVAAVAIAVAGLMGACDPDGQHWPN